MATNGTLTTPRIALGISLLVAGVGILVQYLVGVPGFPRIPPGPIILGVAAILVLALPRYRWLIIVGLVVALFVTVGGLIEGSVWGRLGDPGKFEVWIGAFLQWAGQIAALVSGAPALIRDRRRAPALR